MFSRFFEGRYAPMLATALFSLIPYILVASAAALYRSQVASDISSSQQSLLVVEGLSTAAYAFGALLAGDLINRFAQQRLFFACQALFIAGWLAVALSTNVYWYGGGRIASGAATGMLLVIALPPVVRRFPPSRLPVTAAFINLGLFGAVAAGPLLGGFVAEMHAWRLLYGAFALMGVAIVVVARVTLPHTEPFNRDLRVDFHGLTLGFATTFLLFLASGELASHGFSNVFVAVPMVIGLLCFVALILVEHHKDEALAPVAMMWTTLPVIGTIIAMFGGGAFVTLVVLTLRSLVDIKHFTPLQAGLAFWPQIVGVLIAALLVGGLFRTRFLPLLAFAGMVLIIAAGWLLLSLNGDHYTLRLLLAVGMLGLGAGATVAPGLFLAGLSLPAKILGRIFALVELIRSVADFIMAPVMMKVAEKASAPAEISAAGIHEAMELTLIITVVSVAVCLVLYVLGGTRSERPDLDAWLDRDGLGMTSPPLMKVLRARV